MIHYHQQRNTGHAELHRQLHFLIHIHFANDDIFMDFIETAKSLSLYDTGVTVTATDHIITLITCDRTFAAKEGRLVVMAVEQ